MQSILKEKVVFSALLPQLVVVAEAHLIQAIMVVVVPVEALALQLVATTTVALELQIKEAMVEILLVMVRQQAAVVQALMVKMVNHLPHITAEQVALV